MKSFLFAAIFCSLFLSMNAQDYTPTAENVAARHEFQDNKYGMFIHWGLSSVLANGEWVMQTRKIKKEDYKRMLRVFDPIDFDAAQWVKTAKDAGMNYIVFITRHHDGFSNWDTKFSDWKITNTPYKKDALKALAEECKKQGMKLGLYYSLLDWYRDDYPWSTGKTGQDAGRDKTKEDYASYLQFMKNQLTELLTNYGDIMCIWFDGHWDQTAPEGAADRTSRLDWKYNEIYSLIHKLQPKCLIGNNHHMDPFPGEDFQMFEKDLPGQNKSGLSFQKATEEMPVETCETINGAWGYNITDRDYKTVTEVVRYLAGAAGRNVNLLLNVGPMPNGLIQSEFTDTLAAAGKWLKANAESIYGTRRGPLAATDSIVSTQREKKVYIHLFKAPAGNQVVIPGYTAKVKQVSLLGSTNKLKFKSSKEGLVIPLEGVKVDGADTVVLVELK